MSDYRSRVVELAERARCDRRRFDPPADPPDAERATAFLRRGVGEVVAVYVDARTSERGRFDAVEHSLLERALNDWLELYARCHGYDIDAQFAVREVAELVVKTHDLGDAAQLLTDVPERRPEKD